MSKRDPNYDPELAKELIANQKARASQGAPGPLPTGMAGLSARWQVGFIGTEPYEARRPVARTYVATWGTLVALVLTLNGLVVAGAAVTIALLLIGAPRAWTWAHDRLSAGAWLLGLALAAIGAVIWATGGASAHGTLTTHSGSNTALVITLVAAFVALLGDYRRWGTGGRSQAGTTIRNAADQAVLAEAVAREHRPAAGSGPASDADTANALDDAFRRDH